MVRFGTAGWRGIMGDEFTFKNVRIVAQSLYEILKKRYDDVKIAIDYDTRYLSSEFAKEIAEFLSRKSVKILISSKDSPIPSLSYRIIKNKLSAGIMVTASNNPPLYNGLKLLSSKGASFSDEEIDELQRTLETISSEFFYKPLYPKREFINFVDFRDEYLSFLESHVDFELIKRGAKKIVFDPMFGTTRNYLDFVLRKYDVSVITMHNYTDPRFGGSLPILSMESMKELKSKVLKEKADIGIAIDVDGDRFGIIDDTGKHLNPNFVLAFLLKYVCERKRCKGNIAKSIATSNLVDKIAEKFSVKVFQTPVGTKYISNLIARGDVMIGIEHSAGIWCKNYLPERDAMYASLLLLEAIGFYKKPLSTLMKELFDEYGRFYYIEKKIHTNERNLDNYKKFCNIKIDMIKGVKVSEESRLDGKKFLFEDGSWLLVRRSGTEPLIRVYSESLNKKRANELSNFAMEFLNG